MNVRKEGDIWRVQRLLDVSVALNSSAKLQ